MKKKLNRYFWHWKKHNPIVLFRLVSSSNIYIDCNFIHSKKFFMRFYENLVNKWKNELNCHKCRNVVVFSHLFTIFFHLLPCHYSLFPYHYIFLIKLKLKLLKVFQRVCFIVWQRIFIFINAAGYNRSV